MKHPLPLIVSVVALNAGPACAQTADHAPTRSAAEAAAQYDKSVGKGDPASAGKDAQTGSSGSSAGTVTSTSKSPTDPGNRETAAPNSTSDKAK